MGLSIIKMLSGSIDDEGKLFLNMTCELVMGLPQPGEMLYTGQADTCHQSYKITDVLKDPQNGLLYLTLYMGGPEFEEDWRDFLSPQSPLATIL